MGPLYSIRIPRVRIYFGYCSLLLCFTYETLTLSCQASHPVRLHLLLPSSVLTLKILLLLVWPLSLSLATTREISVDFFSSAYLDVSVRGVPHVYLCIQYTFHSSSLWEFPHSDICGSRLICSSPQLFAACHVLLRLLMPRHSPYALLRLNLFPSSLFSFELLEFLNISLFRFVNSFVKRFYPFAWIFFHLSVKL